ncbi:hypothetical protein OHS71_23850 [Streptomyces sp. NBC_00377]|uniref:hypothetical protein n=1 Tax=unclassified Streptomyces TaxID=2593676 RepID=UPI002E1B817A|nr:MULTISPECIES: hypothetical protein [unclassified Streptomyces]
MPYSSYVEQLLRISRPRALGQLSFLLPALESRDTDFRKHDSDDPWYRNEGDGHAYAVPDDGVVIHPIAAVNKVGRAVLRQAAEAARRPDDGEPGALAPAADGADT